MPTPFKATYSSVITSPYATEDDNGDYQFFMPHYLTAADNHSIANNNKTILESAAETVSNIPKFIGASVLSGAAQLYNIAPTLGNYLGGDYETVKTEDVISALDDDLGKYYTEHQQSADTIGFLLSSLVPGLGGIKVLNAGQKALHVAIEGGRFGNNMSKALGLLAPQKQKHLTAAIKELTNSKSLSILTKRDTIRGLAAGYGQALYETAAFETATALTLQASPIIEAQDLGDITTNIAIGAVAFGTIGGVVNVTRGYYGVKNAVKAGDRALAPIEDIPELQKAASPSDNLVHNAAQKHATPNIEITPTPELEAATIEAARGRRINTLNGRIRRNFGELAKGDQEVAEQMYNIEIGSAFRDTVGNYHGARRISRINDFTPEEAAIRRIDKRVKKGTASIEEAEAASNIEHAAAYIRTWGDNAGKYTSELPVARALADELKKGQQIIIKNNKVTVGRLSWNFKPKKGESWDIRKVGVKEAQARYILSLESAPFVKANKEFKSAAVDEFDLPFLEKLYREFDPRHEVILSNGSKRSFTDSNELLDFIENQKIQLGMDLLQGSAKSAKKLTQEEIASMLNVRNSYLSGTFRENRVEDLFALESYATDYTKELIKKGIHKESDGLIRVWMKPQTIKFSYDTTIFKGVTNNKIKGLASIAQRDRLHADSVDRVVASYLMEDYEKFPGISQALVEDANRSGAGASLITAASANPGSLASMTEYIGQATTGVIERSQGALRDTLTPYLTKLAGNRDATIEWSTLSARLRAIPDKYVLDEEGTGLIPQVIKRYKEMIAEGKTPDQPKLIAEDAPEFIPIKNQATRNLVRAHIEENGRRLEYKIELTNAESGNMNRIHPDVFYPTPINTKDFPSFALVVDGSITGTGHKSTIYAANDQDLAAMMGKLQDQPHLKIYTNKDLQTHFKDIGAFEQGKTIHENDIDILLQRKGISAPYYVPTDPQKITSELLEWHLREETTLVRDMVSAKYYKQFEQLRTRGEEFTNLATSKFSAAALTKHAENVVKNPYMNYIKTALGIKNYQDYPWWTSFNRSLDAKVSEMYDRTARTVDSAKTTDELKPVNALLREYGYKGAAYDPQMEVLANVQASKGVLLNFVQKANALLVQPVLRWDTLNAVNNWISHNILYGAESSHIIRSIQAGNKEAVGELAALSNIKLPGTEQYIFSPQKLLSRAYAAFGDYKFRENTELYNFFKENRFITSISDQYNWTLDNLAIRGNESIAAAEGRLKKVHDSLRGASNKLEHWTGNKLAEEFNRFAAAHVMKDITDIAVKHHIIDSKTALAYINTFVNRTQGNYLSAQRPLLFSGPVGQAIGLFQTYQFNLMQQLLRYVGEGAAKDSATLLGLQGTIYGLNGLPAFNAINTHIIGTASGNTEHKDAYSTVYGAAGKNAGDWLMYGLASNMLLHPDLKTNLYTRGDINPRHLTIVPTDPASVPIVQAYGKFFANIFDTASKVAGGADLSSAVLQGLEHNSLSRPLAGIAQTLEGLTNPEYASYSTSRRGNVVAANDFLSLVNLARIAGGKPLSEAAAIDAVYRQKAYALKDQKRRNALGETIKTTMIAGGMPSQDDVNDFAYKYAAIGGDLTEFNKWMLQLYKTANTSQANELKKDLENPFSKQMQVIMGGYELRDFNQ